MPVRTLNLTFPIKQDFMTKVKLTFLQNKFRTSLQADVDSALRKSNIVHFARFLLIGDDYLQILTEYDGDFRAYTDFFAKELSSVFAEVFQLVDGAPSGSDARDPDKFYKFIEKHDLAPINDYVFKRTGDKTVLEIETALKNP